MGIYHRQILGGLEIWLKSREILQYLKKKISLFSEFWNGQNFLVIGSIVIILDVLECFDYVFSYFSTFVR